MSADRVPCPPLSKGALKCRDLGISIGRLTPGPRNDITDVAGVSVGHRTVDDSETHVHTGVTAVKPSPNPAWYAPVPAAVHVINGFGKTMGIAQVEELGRLETPILLTNTFSIGAVHEGMLRFALREDAELRTGRVTLNPVVGECNDSQLSNIQALAVRPGHAIDALDAADSHATAQGSVGAGRGMVMFGYKGGIGTASRTLPGGNVGILVLANFGRQDELMIAGRPVGRHLVSEKRPAPDVRSAGSVIVVLATDLLVDQRTLHRALRRVQSGLARTGANVAHASGELAIGFRSDFRRTPSDLQRQAEPSETQTDLFFDATVEATEEAVLNALLNAESVSTASPVPTFPTERLPELMTWSPR